MYNILIRIPDLSFINAKGLSKTQLSSLKSEVDSIATENRGEVGFLMDHYMLIKKTSISAG